MPASELVLDDAQVGVALVEFPTTFEAARAAPSGGLRVLMRSPNLILGGSHSGNVAAGERVA